MVDRLKANIIAIMSAAFPRIDRYALYYGQVVGFNAANQTVDVQPIDKRLPTMAGVPIRGSAGTTINLALPPSGPPTSVLIGWENGDPARRFACLWQGGESVVITLGGAGAQPPPLGTTYRIAEDAYFAALEAFVAAAASAAPTQAAAFATAAATFHAGAASYLAKNVLVK